MKKNIALFASLSCLILSIGAVIFISGEDVKQTKGVQDEKTIILNSNNGKLNNSYYDPIPSKIKAKTKTGYDVTMQYENARSGNGLLNLKANQGLYYNASPITNINSIEVDFDGELTLGVSDSLKPVSKASFTRNIGQPAHQKIFYFGITREVDAPAENSSETIKAGQYYMAKTNYDKEKYFDLLLDENKAYQVKTIYNQGDWNLQLIANGNKHNGKYLALGYDSRKSIIAKLDVNPFPWSYNDKENTFEGFQDNTRYTLGTKRSRGFTSFGATQNVNYNDFYACHLYELEKDSQMVGDGENYSLISNVSQPIKDVNNAYYFCLNAINQETLIRSITIKYNCLEYLTHAKHEISHDTLDKSSIIPTSYTSSGVKLDYQDLNLFANNILYAYDTNQHIYLRSNGLGYITNLNPINGLKDLKFTDSISDCNVYGAESIETGWNLINPSRGIYTFNKQDQFFKIASKNQDSDFAFKSLTINYSNVELNNAYEPYVTKDVKSLSSPSEANKLIKTSSQSFSNNSYWNSLGYAKNISEAKNNTMNKQISGFNGFRDYLPITNTSVVYNSNLTAYRVADMTYGDNGDSFQINMLDGSVGPIIYRDGAYTFMEDIAAYITAFGDVPVNMRYNSTNTAIKEWGINGRNNYLDYSNNNTSGSFKYETKCYSHRQYFNPVESSNNDYWYSYYESDYGATNFNNEPHQSKSGYPVGVYNDGKSIIRGALRFVWTYSFTNQEFAKHTLSKITNTYDRNVYYTSSHYNDFQQYLNYYGGWSLRFGNTTLGNAWGKYVADNHLNEAPIVNLVSLASIK